MPTNPHKKRYRKDLRDAHREYRRERKEIGYTDHPTYKQYSGVIIDFFKEIFKMILFENFTFVTNIGTFTLSAEKVKFTDTKEPPIDVKRTIEKRKKFFHLNDHSHGYIYRMAWITEGIMIKNIKIYELNMTRYDKLAEEYLGRKGLSRYIREAATDRDKKLPIPKTLKYRK